MHTPPWYVLTGGPCAGKTTLILELERRGYHVIHEPARLVIEEELAQGKALAEIRTPPDRLARLALHRALLHEAHLPRDLTVFFDRGIIDSVGYCNYFGFPISEELREASEDARYRAVFLCDLVDFQTDEARNETPEEARGIHEALGAAYESYGFEVIRVPILPVAERADFIIASIPNLSAINTN